jgi:nucleoside-diphosphate-sugar epimerase
MKALVTGGTGFVGRYLVKSLLTEGHACRLLVRPTSDRGAFANEPAVEYRPGDLLDPQSLTGIAEGVDDVYHLAAEGHVSAISEAAFRRFVDVNVNGTAGLLRACKGYPVRKFVHFSSTAAMGLIRKDRIDETDVPRPATPYQKSKLQSEQTVLTLGAELGIPTVVLRPCMIYGVGGQGEFHKFCRLMLKGRFPRLHLGCNRAPLVHVRDVVQGAMLAADRGHPGQVYLIASEDSVDLAEVHRLVNEVYGKKSSYPYIPWPVAYGLAWAAEGWAQLTSRVPLATRRNILSTAANRRFSIAKARDELGYRPQIGFHEGIQETIQWFKEMEP